MARRPRGNVTRLANGYRVRIHVNGRMHSFNLRDRDGPDIHKRTKEPYWTPTAIENEITKKYAELRYDPIDRPDVLMSTLLDRFEREEIDALAPGTRKTYRATLKFIRQYFVDDGPDAYVRTVTGAHVKQYLRWRWTGGKGDKHVVGHRTVAKDRATLHRIFEWARELSLVASNPVAATKQPRGDARQPVILNDKQFEKLLKACAHDDMLWLYVLLLGETGMRAHSEALHVRWEDVDLDGGFLRVASGRGDHRTKSGKERWIPLTSRLHQALRDHFAKYRFAQYDGAAATHVIHHTRARRNHRRGQRITTLSRAFQSAVARAGLPPELHQHDLRHRRVTTWLARGGNPVHVKEALGHADLRTTMGYTHLAREHLRSLVDEPGSRTKRDRKRQDS